MITKKQYFGLDLGEFPEGTETVNISLGMCSLFDMNNEYHFTNYRILLIVRKYLNKRSGIFTTDEYFNVMDRHFGNKSKHAVLNKLTNCVNNTDFPFMTRIGQNVWKANSDQYIMDHVPALFENGAESFRYKKAIPVHVLKLHREQYICYIKMCLGIPAADPETAGNMLEKLHPFQLPIFPSK